MLLQKPLYDLSVPTLNYECIIMKMTNLTEYKDGGGET